MVDDLIEEAARRGREEAERRRLQYQIEDAYSLQIAKVDAKRERTLRRRQRLDEKLEKAKRDATPYVVHIVWLVICVLTFFHFVKGSGDAAFPIFMLFGFIWYGGTKVVNYFFDGK